MRVKTCETCRFWEKDDHGTSCHRYPRTVFSGGDYFPETNRDDWCGEWARKEADDAE